MWLFGINWIDEIFLKFNLFDNICIIILVDMVVIMLWVWMIIVFGCEIVIFILI